MAETENAPAPTTPVEEIQKEWHDLALRVKQLEADRGTLEQENKTLRFLLERAIEHRQKSHGELVLLISSLVGKLPMNDVGVIVARLVEHNAGVAEVCAALIKGKADSPLPQPAVLKALEQTRRELLATLKPTVDELIQLDSPLERDLLQSLVTQPEVFFSPRVVRATRCFIKGQVPRERIVKEFGEEALPFFNDMTTDAKLNPRPKPEEIALAFRPDFEAVFQQHPAALADKRGELMALFQRVQRSKGATDQARALRYAFQKASFLLELVHYYDNQSTEAPDVIFAQRLPALVEPLALPGPQDALDENLIKQVEALLAFVVNPDHRHAVVNNVGKGGGTARTLRYVLKLRDAKTSADSVRNEIIPEFVKHLLPAGKPATASVIGAILRLINPEFQRFVIRALMDSDRLNKADAETLGKAVAKELGINVETVKAVETISPEVERQLAWEKIKSLITGRADPAAIAKAIRDRLHAKYDADELKQSWITLIEVDPIALIRIFCALPYLADGSTDPIARNVMETYVTRLTHEKYLASYNKVMTSLRNMFKANPSSPTLLNFIALVKWVDAGAANKLATDIGMPVTV